MIYKGALDGIGWTGKGWFNGKYLCDKKNNGNNYEIIFEEEGILKLEVEEFKSIRPVNYLVLDSYPKEHEGMKLWDVYEIETELELLTYSNMKKL